MTLNLLTAVNEPDIDIILTSSIMGKIPYILVEGMDDITKYHSIFSNSTNYLDTFQIEAIENIKDYSLGCDEIIRCIDDLYQNHPQKHDQIDKYIISILDKDIRDIKNTIPTHNTYIVLKEYSIESIYVCKESVEILLKLLTKGPVNNITDIIVNDLFLNIVSDLIDEMYYCSLDALNYSLNLNHKMMRYKFEYGFIENNNEIFLNQISADTTYKNILDNLSNSYSFSNDLCSLMKFVKGKWLYRSFIKLVIAGARDLSNKCKNSIITTCCYCKLNKHDQCLYKTISTQGYEYIDNHLFKELPKEKKFIGFNYIIDQFDLRMNAINL